MKKRWYYTLMWLGSLTLAINMVFMIFFAILIPFVNNGFAIIPAIIIRGLPILFLTIIVFDITILLLCVPKTVFSPL